MRADGNQHLAIAKFPLCSLSSYFSNSCPHDRVDKLHCQRVISFAVRAFTVKRRSDTYCGVNICSLTLTIPISSKQNQSYTRHDGRRRQARSLTARE